MIVEAIPHLQGILIALIGWTATALLALDSPKLNVIEQRAMVVFSWAAWMFLAAGALVYRGTLDANALMLYCGGTTMMLALVMSLLSFRWRTRH